MKVSIVLKSLLVAVAALATGCARHSADPSASDGGDEGVGVQIVSLSGEPLPEEIDELRIQLQDLDATGEQREFDSSVSTLQDRDGDERPEGRQLGLVPGHRYRVLVQGLVDRQPRYVGPVGTIQLDEGERRHIRIVMYPVGQAATPQGEAPSARAMHTATRLPDGRVLIAGGFDEATGDVSCSEEAPDGSRCYDFEASSEAFLFDAARGRFFPVEGGMMRARGGHTATVLEDGRVLIAGGSSAMRLRLEPDARNSEGEIVAFEPVFEPKGQQGEPGAHDTFEIFDPSLNAEPQDVERNGDPARGGFRGPARNPMPSGPGQLNQGRFMHAAAAVPNDTRVLLVGGMGSADAARSWEIYDDRKPGGEGVYDNTGNELAQPRRLPSAVAPRDAEPVRVWIVGGNTATSNSELAEIWTPGNDPNGTAEPASDVTEDAFPHPPSGGSGPKPAYSLLKPAVASVAGTHALVAGWFGARCDPDSGEAVFPSDTQGGDSVLCRESKITFTDDDVEAKGGITIDGASGETVPTRVQPVPGPPPPSFGAVAHLDDGTVVMGGGLRRADWNRTLTSTAIFDGKVDSRGAASVPSAPCRQDGTPKACELEGPRMLHTMTALPAGPDFRQADEGNNLRGLPSSPRGGFLAFGGLRLEDDGRPTLLSVPEVTYLQWL